MTTIIGYSWKIGKNVWKQLNKVI